MKEFDVFGLGNPFMDVLCHVDENFFGLFGYEKDRVYFVELEKQEEILEKLGKKPDALEAGGSCGNTMYTMSTLGGTTAYCGHVGTDEYAKEFIRQFDEQGVKTFLGQTEGATANALILIAPDAARTMVDHLGESSALNEGDLDASAIERSKYLYFEGYLWGSDSQKATVRKAIKQAKEVGTLVSMSLSDPFFVDNNREDFLQMVKEDMDLVFCNEDEAKSLTLTDNKDDAVQKLGEYVNHFVMTRGAEGAVIGKDGEIFEIPVVPTNAVDTTGAGDSYAAGYLFGITHGYNPKQAGTLAAHCASRVVAEIGPRFSGDLLESVKEFML